MTSVTVRIAGANGDGIESSGALLMKVAAKSGLHVFGYRGYQSIIRGGHVWYQVRIGDAALNTHGDTADVLIALNQDAIANQKSRLSNNAIVIYDPTKVKPDGLQNNKLIAIPLLDTAIKISGDPIMRNVIAIGAVLKLLGIDISVFDKVIEGMFSRKGGSVVADNIKAASMGYSFGGLSTAYSLKSDGISRYVLDGNTALALGSYSGDCKFYAAYPMTPASGILHWFAAHENKGVLYKQTEDEIAAVNMTIGAASAGVRAMCGTSGGGFSLMVEGLGLAGMLEVPIVIVESQRTGPSTGLPTKTEQADLLFVMHASQGEFPRIVVAPRSVEESFYIAKEAFNLAERYQCPVLILMDLLLSEHAESVNNFNLDFAGIDRGKISETPAEGRFKRYLLTDDGISPRSIPGTAGREFIAGSDEHDEYGDLLSDAFAGLDSSLEMRRKMHSKRMRKIETMLKSEPLFVPQIEHDDAKHFLVTFGSSTGAVREAAEILKQKGLDFGLISFNYLMPLDSERTKALLSGKSLIDVECNYTAQLVHVIKATTGIDIERRILRYDGEAITSSEIAEKALFMLNSHKA